MQQWLWILLNVPMGYVSWEKSCQKMGFGLKAETYRGIVESLDESSFQNMWADKQSL